MKRLLYLGIVLMLASCNNNNHCGNGVQDGDETGVDCGGSCVTLCPTTTNNNNNNPPTGGGLALGDSYQGGLIFYLDGNGGGLIAAPTDQSTGKQWGCYGTSITGADGYGVGTGNQNTIDIVAGCMTSETAADICSNLTLGGYSDWFLPSMDELGALKSSIGPNGSPLGNVGGFDNDNYWSSTEADNANAYVWNFTYGGGASYFYKWHGSFNVRAVRAF